MFSAKIDNSKKLFTRAITAMSVMVDEVILNVSDSGIEASVIDPANVMAVKERIDSSVFSEYTATEARLGIDLVKLSKVLENMNDEIALSLNEEKHQLIMKGSRMTYAMALLDPSAVRKPPQIPMLGGFITATVKGSDFSDAIKSIEGVSDWMWFNTNASEFFIEGVGDTDTIRCDVPTTLSREDLTVEVVQKSLFNGDYLSMVRKVVADVDTLSVKVRTDYPLRLDFSLSDGVSVEYTIAPRVESEP